MTEPADANPESRWKRAWRKRKKWLLKEGAPEALRNPWGTAILSAKSTKPRTSRVDAKSDDEC